MLDLLQKLLIDKLIKDKKVSDLQVLEFRKECQAMLVGTVTKIQEWSPLKFLLARKLISVDPRLIASNPESAIKMFQQALQQLIEERWNTPGGDTIWHSSDDSLQKHESTTKINLLLFNMKICGLIAFTLRCWRLRKNIKTYGKHCNFY